MYQVKSSGYELVGTYECMTCKAAALPFFIFHRGGVLFFVIDIMVTVVFEVSRTSCVVVGTFRTCSLLQQPLNSTHWFQTS